MSERGNFRGGGRGGGRSRGGGDRGGRGGGAGGKDGGERKKENILDLNKYMDKAMTVKFSGGREGEFGCFGLDRVVANTDNHTFPVTGTLKGYDQLMNLVLDNVEEVTRGMLFRIPSTRSKWRLTHPSDDEGNTSTRSLGLLVARGTLLVLIAPVDGSEEIENPFVQGEDDE
jgi:U6 snRNA-associated Sm-like protein LSm7